MPSLEPNWLKWAKELQAIAQIGLTYSVENPFDIERYERIRELAIEILSAHSTIQRELWVELFQQETGYATPKVDVRGVVFHHDQILMVKEASDGGWTLPGGWADVNESPKESVVREIWEESGYQTQAVKLLAVYDRSKHAHHPPLPFHIYKLFILCELIGGEASVSHETSAVGFFAEDDLPNLSVSRVTADQIHRLFDHYRHPDWPTDFD